LEESRFRVIYEENFDWKAFYKIPVNFQKLIKKAIEKRLMIAPLQYGEALLGHWKGKYKLRLSLYRIIYEVKRDKVIVKIIAIGPRKKIYNTKR
jgi:mRNA interferase RelE/StbE